METSRSRALFEKVLDRYSRLSLEGEFRSRGIERPLVLPVRLSREGDGRKTDVGFGTGRRDIRGMLLCLLAGVGVSGGSIMVFVERDVVDDQQHVPLLRCLGHELQVPKVYVASGQIRTPFKCCT